MPIQPTVFQPIRSGDVNLREFDSYKTYSVNNVGFATSSGDLIQYGRYRKTPIIVGDTIYDYPVNSLDQSNMHVVWHAINHRYYEYPYDPAKSHELTDPSNHSKFYWMSSSILSIPYYKVGRQIKPGSVTGSFTAASGYKTDFIDDGNGNLIDTGIVTSSFASASRNIFYLSFNDIYTKTTVTVPQVDSGNFSALPEYSGNIKYILRNTTKTAEANKINLKAGIYSTGSEKVTNGLGVAFADSNSYIRIPHSSDFNRMNKNDDWTVSFWLDAFAWADYYRPIMYKAGIKKETYYDPIDKISKTRDVYDKLPSVSGSYANTRTPFMIYSLDDASDKMQIHFKASDGTSQLHISSSFTFIDGLFYDFMHVGIKNSNSLCQIYINGLASGTSGSLPPGITSNYSDIILGAHPSSSIEPTRDLSLYEIRFYDYAVNDNEMLSLAGNDFENFTAFQTNKIGNAFYKNGQLVISSPIGIHNYGRHPFDTTYNVTYRGTHRIYENEVLVRVPKGSCNVSMNPSATYRPPTVGSATETEVLPGELIKSIFISGSASPYITTIGLYNDNAELLAVAKLAQPIQKRDDIDMYFRIIWDY